MILSERLVGTKRNGRDKSPRRSRGKRLFSRWCGRRGLNPHSQREKDFKSAKFPFFSRGVPGFQISVPVSARSGVPFCRNGMTRQEGLNHAAI